MAPRDVQRQIISERWTTKPKSSGDRRHQSRDWRAPVGMLAALGHVSLRLPLEFNLTSSNRDHHSLRYKAIDSSS